MPKENDNIDFLFDKKEDDDQFDLTDEILGQFSDEIERVGNKLNQFIDKRVHPKTRSKLKHLISQQENKIYDLSHRENQLYYRNGFADGISIILTALTIN